MDRLKTLLADANRYFAQLTKRERMLVMLAGVSVVIFVASITFATITSSISRHETSIADKSLMLQQVDVYAQGYAAAERTRRELEARLSGPPVRLMSHMQELADKHGLTVKSMNDRGEKVTEQVKESVVEVYMNDVPIEKLTSLVNEVERNPRIIKVRKLRLFKSSAGEKMLNVSLTVGTYALAEKS